MIEEPKTMGGTDFALGENLERVEGYMGGCGLLRFPRQAGPLRSELARFLGTVLEPALREWTPRVGAAFGIQEKLWGEVCAWTRDAMQRWFAHIEKPADVQTYVGLREHARRGFISHFPASRFLAGQFKLRDIFARHLCEAYAASPAKRDDLLALLEQEFAERLLNVADFFVAGREEDFLEQEATYRRWLYQLPAGVFTLAQEDGTILEANGYAERMVGLDRRRLTAMNIWQLIPAAEHERARHLFAEAQRRGHSHREDLHLFRNDGAQVPVFFNAGAIEYRHHRFLQTICVDISGRRSLESQLIQSEKMAAIGQLAAGIAHEIRNPLGIIANALFDLAELIDSDNPDVEEDLRIAKEEMGRAQAIINNLLEFSRESRAELEPVDINDLLRRTLQLLAKSLQNSDVRVVTAFGALQPCLANQNGLRQIFLNLITNAVQAMPHGGELRLRTEPLLDGRVQLTFEDTGIGIPAEHLKDIFNPFYTTKEPGQGTGLGLSVVHSVVRRYKGEIRVESEVNRGTTFTIEFPCPCESSLPAADGSAA